MSNAGDGEDENFGGDDSKKSERKRQRERQRRYDLANAFDELASLLSEIEDGSDASAQHRRRRRKSQGGGDAADMDQSDSSGMTRLDLIGRSVEAMRKLHRENIELKRVVEQQREGRDEKTNGFSCPSEFSQRKEVLVMVPTLTSVDHDHGSSHQRPPPQYPPPYYPQPQHGMPSQPPPPSQQQHMGPPPQDYRPAQAGVSYYTGPMHSAPYPYASPSWGTNGPPPQHMKPSPPPHSQYQHAPPPPHYQQQQQQQRSPQQRSPQQLPHEQPGSPRRTSPPSPRRASPPKRDGG